MPNNNDNPLPKLHTVTLVALVDGQSETLLHTEVHQVDRYLGIVRNVVTEAAERDPDPFRKIRPGRRGNPVEVLEVDEAVLFRYKEDGAPHPDEFLRRRVFDSVTALSGFLGVSKTACHVALYNAQAKGSRRATVRGVTFSLVQDAVE
jgi:hypothetical protein